jgi:biotin operon repressor
MIKINNTLTTDHDLSRFLLKDPVSSCLLWYFILDHPGQDEGGSLISVQELAEKLGFTRRVIQKRLDYLIGKGLIIAYSSEFYGGKRLPSNYSINFNSEFFIKTARRKTIIKEESPDVNRMIEMFTDINKSIHGQEYKPSSDPQRGKWVKGAEKIIKLEIDGQPFSMDVYEKVVTFLAHEMKRHIDTGDTYAMRVRDLGNLMYTTEQQTETKYVRAYRKQKVGDTSHITNLLKENDGQEYTPVSGGADNSLWAPL